MKKQFYSRTQIKLIFMKLTLPTLNRSSVACIGAILGLLAVHLASAENETGVPGQKASAEPRVVENAVLTSAPNVPPPLTRKQEAKVIINLEVQEVTKRLTDGV